MSSIHSLKLFSEITRQACYSSFVLEEFAIQSSRLLTLFLLLTLYIPRQLPLLVCHFSGDPEMFSWQSVLCRKRYYILPYPRISVGLFLSQSSGFSFFTHYWTRNSNPIAFGFATTKINPGLFWFLRHHFNCFLESLLFGFSEAIDYIRYLFSTLTAFTCIFWYSLFDEASKGNAKRLTIFLLFQNCRTSTKYFLHDGRWSFIHPLYPLPFILPIHKWHSLMFFVCDMVVSGGSRSLNT